MDARGVCLSAHGSRRFTAIGAAVPGYCLVVVIVDARRHLAPVGDPNLPTDGAFTQLRMELLVLIDDPNQTLLTPKPGVSAVNLRKDQRWTVPESCFK